MAKIYAYPVHWQKITGDEPFSVPSDEFEISPLSAAAQIFIDSIYPNVIDPKPLGEIPAGDYCKVEGLIPDTSYHVDTSETFFIRW